MSRLLSPRALVPLLAVVLLTLASAAASRLSKPWSNTGTLASDAAPVVQLRHVVGGLGQITAITSAGDDRLFVTVQTGRVFIVSGGQVLPVPFLDMSALVLCCGERGLLSIAFHPSYAANGFFFTYSNNAAGDLEIARCQRSAANANRADLSTRVVLLTIPHPVNANHNGGQLQFGPDGDLYFGTGDGGSANDPPCNAQRDDVLLGKLLRIDVDQNVNAPPYYGIPADNPFAGSAMVREEIWAKGLRNPWRFSFDRMTGDLWIGDVGQDQREEIDFQPHSSHGGENYGWKIMEGTRCGDGGSSNCPAGVPPCDSPVFVAPRYEYNHTVGICVIGGYVYRGTLVPALAGRYVYGDYGTGLLWANTDRIAPTVSQLSTFGEDAHGELYLGTQGGDLYTFFDPNAPTATPTASPTVTPAEETTPDREVVRGPRRVFTPRVISPQP